jgi:NitT/TauT family transport system permease protein
VVAAGLGLWELASAAGLLPRLYFPPPSFIARTLARLLVDDGLMVDARATLSRVLAGLLLGGVPGLVIGFVMGWSGRLRAVVDPLVAAAHPVPKIAIFPLLVIIFGIGDMSKVVAIAVAVFFPILISTMTGVRQINPVFFDVGRNYGAGPWRVFFRIVVPGSLPMALAGTRLALNVSLLVAIAVELAASDSGLGAVLWLARETLKVEEIYATLVVVSAVGVGFNLVLQRASARLVPWQEERGET